MRTQRLSTEGVVATDIPSQTFDEAAVRGGMEAKDDSGDRDEAVGDKSRKGYVYKYR